MIAEVQVFALVKAWLLGILLKVRVPERRAKASTPGHAKLCLVVAVVHGWIKHSRLAINRRHVATPQIAMERRRLDLDALKQSLHSELRLIYAGVKWFLQTRCR